MFIPIDYLIGETDDITPNHIVISQKDDPIMFELVTSLQNSNEDFINRILAYYQALTKEDMNH